MVDNNFNILVKNKFISSTNQLLLIENNLKETLNEIIFIENGKIESEQYFNNVCFSINNLLKESLSLISKSKKVIHTTLSDGLFNDVSLEENDFLDIVNKLDAYLTSSMNAVNDINNHTTIIKHEIIEKSHSKKNKDIDLNKFEFTNQQLDFLLSSSFHLNTQLNFFSECIDELTFKVNQIKYDNKNFVEKSIQNEIKQQSELLFKKIDNNSNKILTNLAFETKKIKEDYDKVLNDFDLLKQTFENTKKYNDELQQKILDYDNKLQKLTESSHVKIEKFIETNINSINEELFESRHQTLLENRELYAEAIALAEEFKLSHQDFITLVENAGIYNLTENYSKKSNEEKIQYQDYRKYTALAIIAAIITTIIVLSIPVIEFWGNPQPVSAGYLIILSRLSISIMFFVLALYLSKQASKHYECYQENNRTFLQLAALEPFISRMSDEDKLKIRKKLVPIYFHQDKDGKFTSQSDEVDLPSNFMSVISKLIDKIGSKNSTDESSPSKEKNT